MANMAKQLDAAGADGLVLFNRFYQPDFDLEALEVVPNLILSNSHELLLRLHWIAVHLRQRQGRSRAHRRRPHRHRRGEVHDGRRASRHDDLGAAEARHQLPRHASPPSS